MLLVLFLLSVIVKLIQSISCPDQCSSLCQNNQLSCPACLNRHFQSINTSTKKCSCLNGYEQYQGFDTYCCPIGCRSCNRQGCSECNSNEIKQYNNTLKTNICVCKQLFTKNIKGQCVCSSQFQPQLFYFDDSSMNCLICPPDCTCNSQGCISCFKQSNRRIIKLQSKRSTCNCNNGFREVFGVCKCPQHCNCIDPFNIQCSSQSNRYNSSGNFQCMWPYQNVENRCQCLKPWITILNWNHSLTCQCSSKKDYYSYFLNNKQCSSCYQGCSCNEKGCYQCNTSSASSNINNCYCTNNFSLADSKCECLFPYFYSTQNQTTCSCLSELDNINYYYSNHLQQCYTCPPGCTCNSSGCISCQDGSLRNIVKLSENQFHCPCVQNSKQTFQGKCYCKGIFIQKNNTCICDINALKSVFQYDIDNKQCQLCPMSCKCDSTGCYQCSQESNRIIDINSEGIQICRCKQNFTLQQYAQKCICGGNYTWWIPVETEDEYDYDYDYDYDDEQNVDDQNNDNVIDDDIDDGINNGEDGQDDQNGQNDQDGEDDPIVDKSPKCLCLQPSYQTDNGQCRCMSEVDPINYYWDFIQNKCFHCPFNCICSEGGCIQCSDDALRSVNFYQEKNISICSCLQNAYLVGNYCTICASHEYYFANSCIPCRGCTTCDSRGCITCNQQQYLLDFVCYCQNDRYVNNGKQCGCPQGQSLYDQQNWDYRTCQLCPTFCHICKITYTQDICLKCPQNAHRTDAPSRNCECKENYIEAYPMQSYCCHYSCMTCNQTSCTSCLLYGYRELINQTCQCIYPMIQINKGACICDNSFYLAGGKCLKCPQQCKTCSYLPNQLYVRCTSCYENVNRNISNANCSCNSGYISTVPESYFCVLAHCSQDVLQCKQCKYERVLDQGKCKCPPTTFQNYLKKCQSCSIQGCFQCQRYLLCYNCDVNNSYFLSNLRCYYSNLSIPVIVNYIGTKKILIQFKLQLINMLRYISSTVSIVRIQSPQNIKAYSVIPLNIEYQKLNQDMILTTIFQNTNQTYQNLLFSYTITYEINNEKLLVNEKQVKTTNTINTSNIRYHQQNIYQSVILSTQIMQNFKPTQQSSASFVGSIVFSIFAYVFYILGYKHNQLVFYLQAMSFIGFVIDTTPIVNVVFLYNLRYTYFNYDRNPLQQLIPINYIQNCHGNYYITSTDCNIIRNIGLALVLALTIALLLIITRISHYFLRRYFSLDLRFIYYKKIIYRTLQFFHKATMFPLIFFSIQTLLNAQTPVFVHPSFKRGCNILAGIILVIYFIYIIFELVFNIMSKLYKIQSCVEYLCDILASIAIIKVTNNQSLIGVIIIIVIKDIIYAILRNKYMNQKQAFLLLIATGFSVAVMAMIISKSNRWGIVSVHVVTGFVHLIIYSLLTYWFFKMGKFDKILILPIGGSSQADLMKFMSQEQ